MQHIRDRDTAIVEGSSIVHKAREALMGQRAFCIWFTGLPSSGKSTTARLLEDRLHARSLKTYMLDGDVLRRGLCSDLRFGQSDRDENIRRAAELSRLMVDAGLIVISALISPMAAHRAHARGLFETGQFIEAFVDSPLDVCESRDPKGNYKKARSGAIADFTGITSAYERPTNPELVLRTAEQSTDLIVEGILADLERRGLIGAVR